MSIQYPVLGFEHESPPITTRPAPALINKYFSSNTSSRWRRLLLICRNTSLNWSYIDVLPRQHIY